MTMFLIVLTVAMVAVVFPVVVYFSVKFGTYAYLQGKWQFRKDHQLNEESDK